MDIKYENIAALGYEAYGEAANWKNFRGDPMPKWEDLPEKIRKYWLAATLKVIDVYSSAILA